MAIRGYLGNNHPLVLFDCFASLFYVEFFLILTNYDTAIMSTFPFSLSLCAISGCSPIRQYKRLVADIKAFEVCAAVNII